MRVFTNSPFSCWSIKENKVCSEGTLKNYCQKQYFRFCKTKIREKAICFLSHLPFRRVGACRLGLPTNNGNRIGWCISIQLQLISYWIWPNSSYVRNNSCLWREFLTFLFAIVILKRWYVIIVISDSKVFIWINFIYY